MTTINGDEVLKPNTELIVCRQCGEECLVELTEIDSSEEEQAKAFIGDLICSNGHKYPITMLDVPETEQWLTVAGQLKDIESKIDVLSDLIIERNPGISAEDVEEVLKNIRKAADDQHTRKDVMPWWNGDAVDNND